VGLAAVAQLDRFALGSSPRESVSYPNIPARNLVNFQARTPKRARRYTLLRF
jgi:hypothetical protein